MAARLEIHPAIGIARVGTSNSHFVFAGPASAHLPRRDAQGLIRQAAEFRVYKVERDGTGRVTHAEEVTAPGVKIEWTVHVANRKAAGNRFSGDGRRNGAAGDDATDRALIIDAGAQTVANPGDRKNLDGAFRGQPVHLGRIEVAPNGRLIVIGGDGRAASPGSKPIVDFADNDDWFDTVGDGVVRAKVTAPGDQASDALSAWVIVGPPDYAPGVVNLVTMHDVLVDLAITRNLLQPPPRIVFSRHIRPILERAMGQQWVNSAARIGYPGSGLGGHGTDGVGDFGPDMRNLSDPAAPNGGRKHIFDLLRDPAAAANPNASRRRMPRLNDDQNSGDVFSLTKSMYAAMRLWSLGQFDADAPPPPESEPEALTRAALESCTGGPFFPGIEAGRIMRDATRYMQDEPFRLSPDRLKPGEVTQNNAVPWQADFHQCRWEQDKRLGWWPAQRPDDVLKNANADPVPWARAIPDTGEGMVAHWHQLGFVKESPAGSGVFIEQERSPDLPDIGEA